MDIQAESSGNRCVIRIQGKITFEHCPELQNRIDNALGEGTREVTVDFKDVPFIDSSGIGEILRLYKQMRERQGEVILINPNKKLRTLFTMYRFDRFMRIREESEAATE
jgi:anti-sigma B factor antagonist